MIEFLIAPFVACLVITGIHAYLGMHVIERQVIFVDLSLAQIATLGSMVAFTVGLPIDSYEAYVLSLLFAFLGAAIFSFTRMRMEIVPQEAIIGIVYSVSAAAAILLMSRSAEGGEQIKSMLVGNILFVTWENIINIAILYSIIGLFHYIFRNKFISISQDSEEAFKSGINVRMWDFLFYVSFAFVVTSSVKIAGVLLVFSYLVVPSVCAILLSQSIKIRLIIGWILSVIASILGIYFSVIFDFPTGASVICTFGFILFVIWIYKTLILRDNP